MQINLNLMLMSEWRQAQPCESISKGWTDLIGKVRDSFPKEVTVELIIQKQDNKRIVLELKKSLEGLSTT